MVFGSTDLEVPHKDRSGHPSPSHMFVVVPTWQNQKKHVHRASNIPRSRATIFHRTQTAPQVSLHLALIFLRLHFPFVCFLVHFAFERVFEHVTTVTPGAKGGKLGDGGLPGGEGGGLGLPGGGG